ncbi:hypothetical protein F4805DRAFT_432559 [Annulohypoxylon moriforme]|nr:hypothetical protein F4805DRAFT_432559 [Annulohypoxylon moriforme]
MRSRAASYFFAIVAMVMGFMGGTCSYFAAFAHNELGPYFDQNDMGSYSSQARRAFTHLVVSAVFLWLMDLGFIFTAAIERFRIPCSKFLLIAGGLTVASLQVMVMDDAWGWRTYFNTEGLDHFTSNCRALAGICTANMVLMFFMVVVCVMLMKSED